MILYANINTVNGRTDSIAADNSKSSEIVVEPVAKNLPYEVGFDGPVTLPRDWAMESGGEILNTWYIDSTVQRTGSASVGTFNSIIYFDNSGRAENFITPPINLNSTSQARISFDVSYNYTKYTKDIIGIDSTFADTMKVYISQDCGLTWNKVYSKGGAELATFAKPILNPLSVDQIFKQPADSNWKTQVIDISKYAGNGNVLVKLSYVSGLGGMMYLDNFKMDINTGINQTNQHNVTLFPNPATNYLKVSIENGNILNADVYDLAGNRILSQKGKDQQVTISTSSWKKGMYIIRLVSEQGIYTGKVEVK
jgi:hypothetical protein